jgi:DNA polymerase-4
MYGRAPANINLRSLTAGDRGQVTGDREQQAVITTGCLLLPRFQAEVEAKLLGTPQQALVIHHRGRVKSLSEAGEKAGLKVGMRLAQAQAICPEAEFIALVEDRYQPFWREVLDLCVAHFGGVEPREPGEVFVDLTGLKQPEEALAVVQRAIEERLGFTCRAACGPSKLVAKLGTGKLVTGTYRPGLGLVPVTNLPVPNLDPLPITELWTLDPKTTEHLQALGITTIGLLRSIPRARLAEHFGREARRLHDLARGIDHSRVEPLYPPREIVARQTFPGGADNPETLDRCLRELARKVAGELRLRQEVCGRITLRATPEEGPEASGTLRLRFPSSAEADLLRACRALLGRLNLSAPITALAVKVSECRRDTGRQLSLFHDNRSLHRKRQRTSKALEVIRECFGHDIAILGTEIERPRRERVLAAI